MRSLKLEKFKNKFLLNPSNLYFRYRKYKLLFCLKQGVLISFRVFFMSNYLQRVVKTAYIY